MNSSRNHLGRSVFTTALCYQNHVIFLTEHLERLRRHSQLIGLSIPPSAAIKKDVLAEVASRQPDGFGSLRIEFLAHSEGQDPMTNHFTYQGIALNTLPQSTTLTTHEMPFSSRTGERLKSANYGPFLKINDSYASPLQKPLFLDEDGFVLSSTFANVFFVCNSSKKVFTPPLNSFILSGITRNWLLKMTSFQGFTITEKPIHKDSLNKFNEVFLTSSLKGILPVRRVKTGHTETSLDLKLGAQLQRHFKLFIQAECKVDP